MGLFKYEELQAFVSEGVITPFYEIRLQKLKELTFGNVMKRKNPYLFKAKNILKNEGNNAKIIAVNGCIYGKDSRPYKVDALDGEKNYYKYCGQEFWELISGDNEFYQQIVVPIDEEAKKRDENFRNTYSAKINELTKEFSAAYLTEEGHINWGKLIDFVSKKNNQNSVA